MDIIRRYNALGHRCVWSAKGGYDVDGVRMRAEDAEARLVKLERMANWRPVTRPTQRVLREWSNPTARPKAAKFVTDAEIAFCERIVGGDRQRAIALALQFAAGKLKSVRKTYAALFAAEA